MFLRIAMILYIIHLELSRGMTDSIIKAILNENPLQSLEVRSFIISSKRMIIIQNSMGLLIFIYE